MLETALLRSGSGSPLLALADQCVQCGLCLPHCPTYRLDAAETESPRGRIAYMRALAAGQMAPSAVGDLHLDHCLGCRRCESACPAGVRYGELLSGSRATQFDRAPPGLRKRLQLWLLQSPRSLAGLLALYRLLHPRLPRPWRALPRPPARASGKRPNPGIRPVDPDGSRATAAIFTGCVGASYEGAARAALTTLLSASGVEGMRVAGQACCGAAALHAGDRSSADRLARENARAFAGHPLVLCLATGCAEALSHSLEGTALVQDPIDFLEQRAGRLRFRSASGRRVALHLPCTQRSVVRSDAALRRLLARIPDLDVVELPDTGCCGGAGLHMLAEPRRAKALAEPLLAALANSGSVELLSANIGCRLHLRNGCALPIRHPVELLAEHLE